jgi:hypothetical protein
MLSQWLSAAHWMVLLDALLAVYLIWYRRKSTVTALVFLRIDVLIDPSLLNLDGDPLGSHQYIPYSRHLKPNGLAHQSEALAVTERYPTTV